MKTRIAAGVLLIAVLLGGCAMGETFKAKEVRPGIYMSSDPADFPFPTSGYRVYIVGESHGNRETKTVFQAYLKKLYENANLRDVILEEDQAYETEANAYIHGLSDTLPDGLCLRADILGIIREFNSSLSDNEKVTVHLVDVDSPFPIIYKHMTELHSQLGLVGEAVQMPELSEIQYAKPEKLYGLLDELRSASADQPDILNGLDTVQLSLEWYYLGNLLEIGLPTGMLKNFAPIREDIITKNINYTLTQLSDSPILAFFGTNHGMKAQGFPNSYLPVKGFKSWAERLVDKGITVYSLAMYGASGESFWHERSLPNDEEFLKDFKLEDGTPIVSLFKTHPESNIVYTDLTFGDNSTIRLSPDLLDTPASQLYDGIIIFKEFTSMENACPQ
jgi:hypothetical protein